jgi:hypothetical protein
MRVKHLYFISGLHCDHNDVAVHDSTLAENSNQPQAQLGCMLSIQPIARRYTKQHVKISHPTRSIVLSRVLFNQLQSASSQYLKLFANYSRTPVW